MSPIVETGRTFFQRVLWRDRKRRNVTVTFGLILLSCLLFFFWPPYRIALIRFLVGLGGSRWFVGVDYSPIDEPSYIAYEPGTVITGYPPDAEVIGFAGNGQVKAIPVRRLAWHLVANDRLGSEPVVVTLCTWSNAALAFRATCQGRRLSFRPLRLERSNLVLGDRETNSRWQQFTGTALLGPLAGARLERIPVERTSWADWRRQHPRGLVLAPTGRAPDLTTPHQTCPVMSSYASGDFLLQDVTREDHRLPAKTIVTGLLFPDGEAVAWPVAGGTPARPDGQGGAPVAGTAGVGAWAPTGRADVSPGGEGSGILSPTEVLPGSEDAGFLGEAAARPGAGASPNRLLTGLPESAPVVKVTCYWFAWAEFNPGTRLGLPPANGLRGAVPVIEEGVAGPSGSGRPARPGS
ncbi:MAG: DUF3179 domain-containing protein [Candidatus Riflebacteria bacterium]|nr:DUF3179 domain-containing protein [Candidatus Riflebacteria bacterium]